RHPGLIAAEPRQDAAAKQDVKKLQGTWKVVASEVEGRKVEAAATTASVVIRGAKYTVKYPESGGKKASEMTFTLDPSKKPRAIDFTSTSGPEKGKLSRGIYELAGDTLKICFNPDKDGKRPTEFTTKAGSRLRSVTLERVKE